MIRFKDGYKYQLECHWKWKLHHDFTIACDYENDYYGITTDGWLHAFKGCAWDGATGFPDFDWIMEASLGHDILHWLIAKGIIPESENDLIDRELESIIRAYHRRRPETWWTRSTDKLQRRLAMFRGWYVRKATNLVDQKRGQEKPVRVIQ